LVQRSKQKVAKRAEPEESHQQDTKPETGPEVQEIDLQRKGDISQIMMAGKERKQSLRGFDDDYVDIVDYIVKITHRIWEEKGIGLIYDTYQQNISIWTTDGLTYGREAVVEGTLRAQAAFPDVRLYADEVIWTGDDEQGFHTSHRITWVAHNTGYSVYGPPTGRKIVRRGIANCFVKENRIVEEWIARDEMSVVQQLGLDLWELLPRLVAADAARGTEDVYGELKRQVGQNPPQPWPEKGGAFDIEDFVRGSYHEIWNCRRLDRIAQRYAGNYLCHAPSSRELIGLGDYTAFVLMLLGAFPDAVLTIDHLYWMGNEQDGYRVMVRWNLQGTHRGPGPYGAPTGQRVYLLGISHHSVKDGKLVEEWTCFDEVALLKQLYVPPDLDDIPF
jgi:predicted ester cyclase